MWWARVSGRTPERLCARTFRSLCAAFSTLLAGCVQSRGSGPKHCMELMESSLALFCRLVQCAFVCFLCMRAYVLPPLPHPLRTHTHACTHLCMHARTHTHPPHARARRREGPAISPLYQAFDFNDGTVSGKMATWMLLMYGGSSLVGDLLNNTNTDGRSGLGAGPCRPATQHYITGDWRTACVRMYIKLSCSLPPGRLNAHTMY